MEVAPAELAAKRLGARPARQPLLDRPRREAAEVQVGREARGAVARRARRGRRCSRGSGRRGSGRAPGAPAASPPGAGSATSWLEPERPQRRDPALGESRRAAPGARAAPRARRGAAPPASCGERGRRRCRACPGLVSIARDVDRVQPVVRAQLDARVARAPGGARSPRRRANGLTSWVTWIALGADLAGERRPARARARPRRIDEARCRARAARASRSARHSSRNCVRGPERVAAVQQPVVEAEDRDDPLVLVERRPQRRVVADPQVAPKPDDPRCRRRRSAASLGRRSTTSLAGASKTSSRRKSIAVAAWSQNPHASIARGASFGAGEIGSAHAGQTSAPRASTWRPSVTRRGLADAEPPVRPCLTSGSPRSPGSGAISKATRPIVGSALTVAFDRGGRNELLRHRRHRLHRPQPGRAPARARGDDLRARPRGLEGPPGGAAQPLGRRRGPDRRHRRRPLRAAPRRLRRGPRPARGRGRPPLPPRGDLRHDRERREPAGRQRRGHPPHGPVRRGGRGRARPHGQLDRRRRPLQGHLARGHVRGGPGRRQPPLLPDQARVRGRRPQRVLAARGASTGPGSSSATPRPARWTRSTGPTTSSS